MTIELTLNGVALHPAKELTVQCLIDDGGLGENIASALRHNHPWVNEAPAHERRLAIVGSGPSVRSYMHELRMWGGDIWAINGAFCWLREAGIKCDFVCLDPDDGLEALLPFAPMDATYYLAAVCAPSLFDWISDRNVQVWFPDMTCKKDYPVGAPLVVGATTCLTRAPFLGHMMGYRDFTLFGGDSSFETSMYCYDPARYSCSVEPTIRKVRVGDQIFLTNRQMMHQVANLIGMTLVFGDMLKFRVGGLMEAILAAPVAEIEAQEAA